MFHRVKKSFCGFLVLVIALTLIPSTLLAKEVEETKKSAQYRIIIGQETTEMQEYAAKELQKYLFQLSGESVEIVPEEEGMNVKNAYVLGTAATNSQLSLVEDELSTIGEQGYVLKKIDSTLYIGGYDDEGVLYGVYGLLDDYYDIGFYFSGDIIPAKKSELTLPEVDEAKTPRQYMRGILPWTNFPQSSTVYSTEDWKFIIDQMARMRMNFLNIHNYNGQSGHNEMFHNFTYNGITSRNWNATAKTGHRWSGPGWDVNEYRFGGTDLFDDYDFGAESTLHNESLDNLQVFAKGYSQFQYIIDYAHTRGVKIGLGLDINLVMPDYGVSANAEGLPELQAQTIMENYEDLDTLILYVSETIVNYPDQLALWRDCFNRMYETIRKERPDMQIAVSGWGLKTSITETLPEDVVIAPIADYEAGFVNGAQTYGEDTEYWGGPWMERDFESSVYFYPFRTGLDKTMTNQYQNPPHTWKPGTIPSYKVNKDTMKGLFTLTWRLTDGVDAKLGYVAKAPWDLNGEFESKDATIEGSADAARAVYREYVEKCYGVGLSKATIEDLTQLVYEDEANVVPTVWSECEATPGFTGQNRQKDIEAAQGLIDRVDKAIAESKDAGCIARLGKLRDRLVCAQYYCKLDQSFNTAQWEDLQKDFAVWVKSFMTRVDDISSLGNNQSAQNRFVQLHYIARETALRNAQAVKAPLNVTAKGTKTGAELAWEYEENTAQGFNVYRDNERINEQLLSGNARTFEDEDYNGSAVYTVKAVVNDVESAASIPQTCDAGDADKDAPQVIVVSPYTTVAAGQDMAVKARVLDGRSYDCLSAKIHYRAIGSDSDFVVKSMDLRTKSTFTAEVYSMPFVDTGIEYYITVSDGSNTGYWPAAAEQGLNAVCTVYSNPKISGPQAPEAVQAIDRGIQWSKSEGDVQWYRIYRGETPDFTPSPANLVTYVEKETTAFSDTALDFDGSDLSKKTKYYRVTAVDIALNESVPSLAVKVGPQTKDPLKTMLFVDADEYYKCRPADQAGSSKGTVLAWTENGGYAKINQLTFPENSPFNAVEIGYSAHPNAGGAIEVWVGAPSEEQGGKKLGEAEMPPTGAWENFRTVSVPLEPAISGTNDVYFVFRTIKANVLNPFNLDNFRFVSVPEAKEGIEITTRDMMAYKESVNSDMKEDTPSISNFGNSGDRIVLGKGIRAGAEDTSMGGKTQLVDLPTYNNILCYAYFGAVGDWFQFTNVPEGKAYLAYDKNGTDQAHALAVYVNGEKKGDLSLPDGTGSTWGLNVYKVMYKEFGNLSAGDTVQFKCEAACPMNGVKLFVEQDYTAKQMEIHYSNTSDTQCSLYVDGEKVQTVTLPNSNGQARVCMVDEEFADALVELRMDEEDILQNQGKKVNISKMVLYEDNASAVSTVKVTCTEGGTVTPAGDDNGIVTVACGDTQTFEISPDEGYVVSQVFVNGVDYGTRQSYTFENLTYDATLDVKFVRSSQAESYKINIAETTGGRLAVSLNEAQMGQPVTIVVIPDEGYRLKVNSLKYVTERQPEGVAVNEISRQFSMPAEDVTVTAEFELLNPVEPEEPKVEKYKELLQKTYDYALTQSTDGVAESAAEFFETAKTNAKEVLDDANATWEEIEKAWSDLLNGIWGLGIVKGDKEILKILIDKADSMIPNADRYVEANWPQLIDVLAKAKEVYENGDVMQEEVNQAADALYTAILAQRYKADKSNLEELLKKVEGLGLEGYTVESVQAFKTALAKAMTVMADDTLSENDQQIVDDAVKALADAKDGLQLASNDGDNNANSENGDKANNGASGNTITDTGKDAPKTGDTMNVAVWLILMAAVVVTVEESVRRKRR